MHKYLHLALVVTGIYFLLGFTVVAYRGITMNTWPSNLGDWFSNVAKWPATLGYSY